MLGIGVLLVWLTFKNVDISETWEKIKNAHFIWMWMTAVCSLLAYFSRAYRWNMLIEPSGYKPKLMSTFYAVCIAYFANLAIPRIGEVTRCGTLSKKEKIPFDLLLGTVIVERVIDVLTLLLAMVILLFMEFDTMWRFLNDNVFGKFKPYFNLTNIAIAIVVLIVFGFIIRLIFKNEKSAAFNKKIKGFLLGLLTGLKSVMQLKNFPLFIFHSLFIWGMYLGMVFLGLRAMDSTAHLGSTAAIFTLVAGGLGMTAPVQGGIGAYHLLVANGLLLFGIDYADGIAFAWLMYLSQILQIAFFGLLALLMLFLTKDHDAKKETKTLEQQL